MSRENVEVVRDLFDRFNAFMRVELTSAAYPEPFDPEIQLHWRDEQTYPDTPQHLLGGAEVIAFTEDYRSSRGERPAFARSSVMDAYFDGTERDSVLGTYAITEEGETTLEAPLGPYRVTAEGEIEPAPVDPVGG